MTNEIMASVVGGIIGLFLALIPILKDVAEGKWKKNFTNDIKDGLKNDLLQFDDLKSLAERWIQDRKSVLFSLRTVHAEAISKKDKDLAEKIDPIRRLIDQHQREEPFSELPENISIQLENLVKSNTESEGLVSHLASSLSELYSANQEKILKQTKLTYLGAVTGVIGLLIGVAGLYFAVVGAA